MKCPICPDARLLISIRQDVEIDYCPECRGIWLDRGELDKLLERSATANPQANREERAPSQMQSQPDFDDSRTPGSTPYPAKRKKSWLNEIFD